MRGFLVYFYSFLTSLLLFLLNLPILCCSFIFFFLATLLTFLLASFHTYLLTCSPIRRLYELASYITILYFFNFYITFYVENAPDMYDLLVCLPILSYILHDWNNLQNFARQIAAILFVCFLYISMYECTMIVCF